MDERMLELTMAHAEEAQQRRIAARVQYQGESAQVCEACDEPIPQKRREAVPGCTLCVHCAGLRERRYG
ncbi:TraR/DksA C4-type zinc finger protein [Atopomonas sediminilitoris]|uniref:TraR/DksA C4-type zinc finger protein n=1 Tax=Atopomonas sediminilitoris TaxID=2919919 RepID=UPI001F4F07FB|nr:TraR/DksA C4-type zinc finger protein [Atopomonas sediminilitoris]MCJ8168651.1 TraR/DksA C4-type zinc finger protein [Atopomonas sediminilitoris]